MPKRMPKLKRSSKKSPGDRSEQGSVDLESLRKDLYAGKAALSPQDDCPLFEIPAEIRNTIFSYTVKEQDGQTAIATTDYWYRPDFTHYRYIETALLRTCRRIWLETYALPRQQITRRYWAGGYDRRPKRLEYAATEAARAQLEHQTKQSRRILPCETAQVFIQMFALERGHDLKNVLRSTEGGIPLRHLIITIRYTDWWFWETNSQLRIDSYWMHKATFPDTLEKLTMELETRQGKKPELDALVQSQISKWVFTTIGKKELTLSPLAPETRNYIGTDRPGGTFYTHHGVHDNPPPNGLPEPLENEMYYYAVTLDYSPNMTA